MTKSNAWCEKYRPKTTDDYVCPKRDNLNITVNYLNSVLKGKPITQGLLFYGAPGTGKTTLTQVMSEVFKDKLSFVWTNASDKRKSADANKFIAQGRSMGIGNGDGTRMRKTIIVLDEAEKMSSLKKVVKHTNPIVIVNDKWELDNSVRKILTELSFPYPTQKHKIEYIDRILRAEGEKLPIATKKAIASNSLSYRDVALNLQLTVLTGDITVVERDDYGMFEEVRRHFKGDEVRNANIKPRELLNWAFDNGGNPALISTLDRIMGRIPPEDFRSWKYVYSLISKTKPKTVKYPYSWRLRGKVKREIAQKKEKEKETKVEVQKSTVKTSSIMDFVE